MNVMRYAVIVVDHRQLFVSCDTLQTCRDMLEARLIINTTGVKPVFALLESYVSTGNPEAEYLLASISSSGEETDEEFDQRHIRLLESSAVKKYPPSMYSLGACYDMGELVAKDTTLAATWFAKAAHAGHAHSQWIHAEDLLYGRNGMHRDESTGIEFMKRAAGAKFVPALEALARFYEHGEFGLPKDQEESRILLAGMHDEDTIDV